MCFSKEGGEGGRETHMPPPAEKGKNEQKPTNQANKKPHQNHKTHKRH